MRRSAVFNPLALVSSWLVVAVLSPGPAAASEIAWVSKLDTGQAFEAGQVVGLFGSGLSLSTAGADRVLIVGESVERGEANAGHAPVALVGRVQVRVMGPIRSGDLLFASGRNDGTAAGLASSDITPAKLRLLVGRALEAHPVRGAGTVDALVGLSDRDALVGLFEAYDELLAAQELELVALRAGLASLEAISTEVVELRRTISVLEALEAARKAEDLAPLPPDPDR